MLELIFRVALGGVLRTSVLRYERIHRAGDVWLCACGCWRASRGLFEREEMEALSVMLRLVVLLAR